MTEKTREIHLISMIRNEADILSAFMTQATNLFDRIYLVDHQSTDGTRAILDQFAAGSDKVEILDFRYRGYYQREISNCLARRAFHNGADWIFFLDADEFLDVEDRASLESMVKGFPNEIMHLRWVNMVPDDPGSYAKFDAGQQFSWHESSSNFGKIAINSGFIARNPHFFVHQGNHSVSPSRFEPFAPMEEGLPILHVPIRSLDRLRYKLDAGRQAYQAKAATRHRSSDGNHWFELHQRLEQGTATTEWINGVISRYGEPLEVIEPVNVSGPGWRKRTLPGSSASATKPGAATLVDTIQADARQSWRKLSTADGAILRGEVKDGEISLKPQPMSGDSLSFEESFATLPPAEESPQIAFDDRQIGEAISRAFMPINKVVPSAWTEHTPFLFALFSLMRPRRYVEIGSHFGMSFFGACQVSAELETGTQCVAIDGWLGDEHAGFYDNETFENFKANLKSLEYPHSYYIRSYFEQSLDCFEDGSIDILHIDGLHTYEAVKNDYETWLPKMSSRGVMLFHDTNVYERNFGVWRLWNELKAIYPHFHFPHCHGLGVIYVGNQASPIANVMRELEKNEGLASAAISIFAGLGSMSVKRTVAEQELSWIRGEHKTLSEEVVRLRETIQYIWTTTSWKLTKPVRLVGRTLKGVRHSIKLRNSA